MIAVNKIRIGIGISIFLCPETVHEEKSQPKMGHNQVSPYECGGHLLWPFRGKTRVELVGDGGLLRLLNPDEIVPARV